MSKIRNHYYNEDYLETFNNLKSGIIARLTKLSISGSTNYSIQELNAKKDQLQDYFKDLESGTKILKTEQEAENELESLSQVFKKLNDEEPNKTHGLTR